MQPPNPNDLAREYSRREENTDRNEQTSAVVVRGGPRRGVVNVFRGPNRVTTETYHDAIVMPFSWPGWFQIEELHGAVHILFVDGPAGESLELLPDEGQ